MLGLGGRACFTLLVGAAVAVLGPAGEKGCASGRKEYLEEDVASALLSGGEADEDEAPAAGRGLMARTESEASGETLRPEEEEADEDMLGESTGHWRGTRQWAGGEEGGYPLLARD